MTRLARWLWKGQHAQIRAANMMPRRVERLAWQKARQDLVGHGWLLGGAAPCTSLSLCLQPWALQECNSLRMDVVGRSGGARSFVGLARKNPGSARGTPEVPPGWRGTWEVPPPPGTATGSPRYGMHMPSCRWASLSAADWGRSGGPPAPSALRGAAWARYRPSPGNTEHPVQRQQDNP